MRCLTILCLLTACAGRDWRIARSADTSEAYASFVATNPTHGKVGVAIARAEVLNWQDAQAIDTAEAYAAYLGAHPNGEHAEEARTRGEARAWEEAVASGTPDALTIYVARHPGTPHAAEAEALIEEAWYRDAKSGGTEDSWGRYIVRYPGGKWIAEARSERERLAWEAATAANSRESYEAYLARYAQGTYAAEAEAWLRSAKVVKLQPVVILRGTWQSDGKRSSVLWRVRNELEKGLLYDLKREFRISKVVVEDPKGAEVPHPQEAWPTDADTGLLVVEYTEAAGRAFEPSGHATDITATLSLYAPPTRVPVWTRKIEVSTPETTYGETVDALHLGAVRELAGTVRSLVPELERHRR